MQDKPLLYLDFSAFQKILKESGFEEYRAKQVWEWIFKKQVFKFSAMTNLSKDLRQKLEEEFPGVLPEPGEIQSDEDGTKKVVLPLADGLSIECVALPDEESMTFCLSSQVGCPVGCLFCRTGTMGFKRNLTPQEMIIQFFLLTKLTGTKPSNVVFMGMGEPFLNAKAVFEAIDVLTDSKGLNFGSRRITISTAGVPDRIRQLAERPGEVNLAVSLHAAENGIRNKLVPLNKKYSLEKLKLAIEDYLAKTGRRVTFEVVLLKGLNDGPDQAMNLAEFCKGMLCHVNLLRFNTFPGCSFKPSPEAAEKEFRKELKKAGINVTVRKSRGSSILAACGQLVGK